MYMVCGMLTIVSVLLKFTAHREVTCLYNNIFRCIWYPASLFIKEVPIIYSHRVWMSIKNGGDKWGRCFKKWKEHSFVSDNARDSITENWSTRLNELEQIQKRKRIETTYKKCARVLLNSFNVTHAVLLLHSQKWQPPGVCYLNFLARPKSEAIIFTAHHFFVSVIQLKTIQHLKE